MQKKYIFGFLDVTNLNFQVRQILLLLVELRSEESVSSTLVDDSKLKKASVLLHIPQTLSLL